MAGFAEYQDYDSVGLAELIAANEITATEALEAAVERVEAANPKVNAVVHKMYDAAAQTIAAGLPDGPLAGAPFMLKDLGAYYAGEPTSFGSRLYADFVPDHDTTLVARYRAAGLVILAKTNTPEMGICAATEPALHGPTRNPWNPALGAGGSSGGAAAAVATGMVAAAHASDGGGSIRIPAAQCGVFGLKPTRARNPAGPDLGEGWSGLATNHVVSRSVRDSAALLDATSGPAPGDPYWAPPPARPFRDEVGADPGRLRIAVAATAPGGCDLDPACAAASEAAAKLCADLGHHVEWATFHYDFDALRQVMWTIVAANLNNTLALRGREIGREPTRQDVEGITWACAEHGRQISGPDYARAIQVIHGLGRQLAGFFADYDLLLSSTMAVPPPPIGAYDMSGDDLDTFIDRMMADMPITPLYNLAGNPAMSVPLHWTAAGLPIGVHFGAPFGDEAALFRLAAQLEAARPWADRRPVL